MNWRRQSSFSGWLIARSRCNREPVVNEVLCPLVNQGKCFCLVLLSSRIVKLHVQSRVLMPCFLFFTIVQMHTIQIQNSETKLLGHRGRARSPCH
uniref:Uncharacterized protein MANES_02G077800 n=1 Tax=Rhizophora mucronata TaxID=61149 RepID=A0A2P2KDF8_RHIMU